MLILALKLDHHTQMLMHQLLSSFWLTKLFKQNSQILMQKQQQNIIHTAANFGKFANIICSYFPFCLQVSFTWFLFIPSRQLHIYIPTQQKNTGWSCIESGLPTDVCDFAWQHEKREGHKSGSKWKLVHFPLCFLPWINDATIWAVSVVFFPLHARLAHFLQNIMAASRWRCNLNFSSPQRV